MEGPDAARVHAPCPGCSSDLPNNKRQTNAMRDSNRPFLFPLRAGASRLRLAVIADDDFMRLPENIRPADILLSLGDVHPHTVARAVRLFRPQRTFVVHGNHDIPGPWPEGMEDLHGRSARAFGLTFAGLCGSLRYKSTPGFMLTQEKARAVMMRLPAVDVLISHNSPAGYHEQDDFAHQGFQAVTEYIDRHAPALVLHGHQHVNAVSRRGRTLIAGVFGCRVFELRLDTLKTPE